ncbi:aspartyl protease family protein [Selenomonas sp. AB3002]|uniref:aspartyl protease family protein n=1 Tax=Selenomonas sp. AB3002 TaxID=1392502 RepID=UPI0004984496
MNQFTLRLREDVQRPTAILTNFSHLHAMLDTGAVLPVWVSNETLLKSLGGVPIAPDQPFGGFGGMTTGTIYRLPTFQIGELIFPEFPIIASRIDLPCQMILSATMFNGLIYEIDDWNHKFNVTIPDHESHVRKLTIEDKNGTLHILCTGE